MIKKSKISRLCWDADKASGKNQSRTFSILSEVLSLKDAGCIVILSRLWQFLKKGIGIPKSNFSALLLSGIFAFCILHSNCDAQEKADEELKLYLGEVKIISVSNPTRIAIGNPNVADVTDVTRSEITISPKAQGTTTLVVWDNFGEQSYRVKVFAEDIQEIKCRVDGLLAKLNLPEVYARAKEEEGKVLLLGRVKSPQDRERITVALGTLSEKIIDLIVVREEEAVVEIDVQVLELNKDAINTLGFVWPTSIALTETGSPGITTSTPTQVGTTQTITEVLSGGSKWSTLFKVLNLRRAAFSWTLDALVEEGKARILSRPRLACQSGKEAELIVGGEKPIMTLQLGVFGGVTGSEVDYKEYGIKLKIKPTVTLENKVKLALNVEVSEVEAAETIGSATTTYAKAYPLKKRNVSTELFLNDGQTMAIGGLIKQKTEEDIHKTAGLGDIPILGLFFRKKTTKIGGGGGERGDTELFITLTPTIVSKETKETPEVKTSSSKKIPAKEVEFFQTPKTLPNLANYVRVVQTKIVKATYYPRQAKDAGWEGNVKLSLNITSNGDLKEIKILQSSGYKILDEAACEAASKQAPYPPFPPQIDSQELWVDVPIVYREN